MSTSNRTAELPYEETIEVEITIPNTAVHKRGDVTEEVLKLPVDTIREVMTGERSGAAVIPNDVIAGLDQWLAYRTGPGEGGQEHEYEVSVADSLREYFGLGPSEETGGGKGELTEAHMEAAREGLDPRVFSTGARRRVPDDWTPYLEADSECVRQRAARLLGRSGPAVSTPNDLHQER